jgi:hypothetical protein
VEKNLPIIIVNSAVDFPDDSDISMEIHTGTFNEAVNYFLLSDLIGVDNNLITVPLYLCRIHGSFKETITNT